MEAHQLHSRLQEQHGVKTALDLRPDDHQQGWRPHLPEELRRFARNTPLAPCHEGLADVHTSVICRGS